MEITRETIRLKHEHLPPDQLALMIEKGGEGLVERSELIGGLSLIFWALILLSIKYDMLIMRADDRGGGGTFCSLGPLERLHRKNFWFTLLGYLVVAAAALLAADGIITPPISMLGAFRTIRETWSVIITIACLFGLFKAQWRGTSKVGGLFGWFMLTIWFPWIAIKGLPWVFCAA